MLAWHYSFKTTMLKLHENRITATFTTVIFLDELLQHRSPLPRKKVINKTQDRWIDKILLCGFQIWIFPTQKLYVQK